MKQLSIIRTMTLGKTSVRTLCRPGRNRTRQAVSDPGAARLPIVAALPSADGTSRAISPHPCSPTGRTRKAPAQRTNLTGARVLSENSRLRRHDRGARYASRSIRLPRTTTAPEISRNPELR